ncbi:MAG: dihydropteroate synthase [Chloroflexota bacterium]
MIIKSANRVVEIGPDQRTVMIGERINPTGKKRLAASLQQGDLSIVRQEAIQQESAGANILDVNVGAAGVDEVTLLPQAVQAVREATSLPICVDSANAKALEAALAMLRELEPEGIPLVNSVNGEESSLESILPLAAEYNTAVIGLCMDDNGIPDTVSGRVSVAAKILERAQSLGIDRDRVLIDGLALTMGADSQAGRTTLETLSAIRQDLGACTVLGASNASFGLPDREILNGVFFSLAIHAGANALIMDVKKTGMYVAAADLALGRDEYAMAYIQEYRKRKK